MTKYGIYARETCGHCNSGQAVTLAWNVWLRTYSDMSGGYESLGAYIADHPQPPEPMTETCARCNGLGELDPVWLPLDTLVAAVLHRIKAAQTTSTDAVHDIPLPPIGGLRRALGLDEAVRLAERARPSPGFAVGDDVRWTKGDGEPRGIVRDTRDGESLVRLTEGTLNGCAEWFGNSVLERITP